MGRGILLWLFGVPIPIIIRWRLSGTEEAIMALTTQTTNPAALVTDSPSAVSWAAVIAGGLPPSPSH